MRDAHAKETRAAAMRTLVRILVVICQDCFVAVLNPLLHLHVDRAEVGFEVLVEFSEGRVQVLLLVVVAVPLDPRRPGLRSWRLLLLL
jgi:hypothetical protein